MIEVVYPYFPKKEVKEAVADVLDGRWIGQGPKVEQFERDFSKLFSVQYPIAVNSGTAALETAYDLIGLKPGDEVITTVLTCTATNLPLIRKGVKLVFADILESTLCIDPEDVKRKITPKTKAIVQVHLGGIQAECSKYVTGDNRGYEQKIPIVSDACQALGIFVGDYTCCSFQAIKHITTGDGGMIVCPTLETTYDAKLLRWFGINREKKIANNWAAYKQRKMTFDIELPGTKRHMTDIAAAMGIEGLKRYIHVMDHRSRLFNIYKDRLSKVSGIRLVDGLNNTYWLATVIVERRDKFAEMLFEANVDTNLIQCRNDVYRIFGGKRQNLPVMNKLEDKYISIPLHMNMTEEDASYICDCIERGW